MRQFHNQADSEGVMRLASEYQLGHYNESASDLNRVKVRIAVRGYYQRILVRVLVIKHCNALVD